MILADRVLVIFGASRYNVDMATVSQPDVDLVEVVPLHRFSTADYLGMIEKGVLGRNDHVELIGGVIVEMSPAGIPHNHYPDTNRAIVCTAAVAI